MPFSPCSSSKWRGCHPQCMRASHSAAAGSSRQPQARPAPWRPSFPVVVSLWKAGAPPTRPAGQGDDPMSEARRGVCVVIGAGEGLGGSIARAFAREGLAVCITRRPRHVEALGDDGRKHSRRRRRSARLRARRAQGSRRRRLHRDRRAVDRADRGPRLQHRRQCALSRARDDDAGLFQGLGNGLPRRVPREPRGGARDGSEGAGGDPLHRGDRERARRRRLLGLCRREARTSRAGAEFWRANWGRKACMSPMS